CDAYTFGKRKAEVAENAGARRWRHSTKIRAETGSRPNTTEGDDLKHLRSLLGALALACGLSASAASTSEAHAGAGTPAPDPFLWLEEIEGKRALEWVDEQNQRSLDHLT